MALIAPDSLLKRLRRGAWLRFLSAAGAFVVIGALAAMVAFLLLQTWPLLATLKARSSASIALTNVVSVFPGPSDVLIVTATGEILRWDAGLDDAQTLCRIDIQPERSWANVQTLWIADALGRSVQVDLKSCASVELKTRVLPWQAQVINGELRRSARWDDFRAVAAGVIAIRVRSGQLEFAQGKQFSELKVVAALPLASNTAVTLNPSGDRVLLRHLISGAEVLRVVREPSGRVLLLAAPALKGQSLNPRQVEFIDDDGIFWIGADGSLSLSDAANGALVGRLSGIGEMRFAKVAPANRHVYLVSDSALKRLQLSDIHAGASFASLWWPLPRMDADASRFVWMPEGPNDSSARYSLLPLLASTLLLGGLALILALPIALSLAAYVQLSALSSRYHIRLAIELIEAIPSILIAFCVLIFLSPLCAGLPFAAAGLLVGSLAFVLVPTIFAVTDEALSAVPRALAEGALALGAKPLRAFYSITLPAAAPGLLSATLLGFGRAISETMLVLLLASMLQPEALDWLPIPLPLGATLTAELPEVPFGSTHFRVLFLAALLLLALSLSVNFAAEQLRSRLRRRLGQLR